MNTNIQDIYSFCNIGLILINDENEIEWFNEEFYEIDKERSILNKNIFSFCNDLQKIFLNNYKDYVVKISNKFYKVRYLKNLKLFVFFDIEKIKNLEKRIENNRFVVGIIMIDNYLSVSLAIDNDNVNSSVSNIKSLIINYARKKKNIIE